MAPAMSCEVTPKFVVFASLYVSASEKLSHPGRCWSGPVIHRNPLARTQYEF